MRSTTPSSRRHMSRPGHDRLTAVARVVDQCSVHDPGHVLVHLGEPRTEVGLGLRSCDIGVHPFEVLAGFTAPDDWWAFGIRVRGRAHRVDDPGRVMERVATTFLVDRDGIEASVLRSADAVTSLTGSAEGTIADLCRRVLGLPTAPAPDTTNALWTTRWLDAVLTEWGKPERRRAVSTDFTALSALHPATGGRSISDPAELAAIVQAHTRRWTWEALRHAPDPLPLPDGPLPPEIARWMDDGFFARWTLGAYPSAATLATDLRGLLSEPVGARLVEAMAAIVEREEQPRSGRPPR